MKYMCINYVVATSVVAAWPYVNKQCVDIYLPAHTSFTRKVVVMLCLSRM
jgi:hypothetical protein